MAPPHPENISILEKSLELTIGDNFSLEQDPDVIAQLIGDTRSPNTKKAYEKDLKDFFSYIDGNHGNWKDKN